MKSIFCGRYHTLFILILIAFLLRIGFMIVKQSFENPNDWEYGDIAQNLVAGNGFARIADPGGILEKTSSHAPVYPLFLSLFYRFGQGPMVFFTIQLIQIILSLLTIILVYQIATSLFNHTSGAISALIAALYPPLIYYSCKLTPTTFYLFFLLLFIFLVLKFIDGGYRNPVVAGIILGLAILTNTTALAIFPALIIWSFIKKSIPLKSVILCLAIAVIILIPWTIRNYRVHKILVPVTTQFGINLWIGNNLHATGTDYYRVTSAKSGDFILMTQTLPRQAKIELNSMSEIERMEFFINQAVNFIISKPDMFLWLLLKKSYFYWWFAPLEINGSRDAEKYRIPYMLCYLPILLLGIVGMILSLTGVHGQDASLLVIIMILIACPYIIAHIGLTRYRIPVEIILIILAGYGVKCLHEVFKKKCKWSC